ncbi:nitrilase-related carbon-nitrogen hydrolase [Negadavirga shengliensis]|uniref:Nitrilase-related carbon-nitrogen hydrolase n=1 Tax=Negadavirga shengliensis TaxID=1389218 RepID=A0ABV9SZP0_9BACT
MENAPNSRRNFLKNTALATGMTALGSSMAMARQGGENTIKKARAPREVWVAGVSQESLSTATSEEMSELLMGYMEQTGTYHPDIICLPEIFPTSNVKKSYTLTEKATISDQVVNRMASFAKAQGCYVIVPVYTVENGNTFNSAVILDRSGKNMGEYRKMHLTEGEMAKGLTPGPLDPPVFDTDFGRIGVQICFDIMWDDGWSKLKEKGAEMVFWPSAYGGGQNINLKALSHRYVVATSTRKGASKIADVTGEDVTYTGFWNRNLYCAPVNLEKAFLHTWPYVEQFDQIRKEYGRNVRITNFHEEEWSIIESLSPEVSVASIMKKYGLKTYDQHRYDAEMAQIEARNKLNKK